MTSIFHRACGMSVALITVGALASAQESPVNTWSRGTTLNIFAGASSEPHKGAFTAGGAIGWQLTPAMAVEGTGAWVDNQSSPTWFTAAMKFQARIAPVGGTNPYVEGGIGLCRSSFDAGDLNVPEFYRKRMVDNPLRTSVMSRTFTDPTFAYGAGLNIIATRHIAIRPAAEFTTVFRNHDTLTIMAGVVRVAYHFENHPVTPTGKTR